MSLKMKIDKAAFAALTDEGKAMYKANEDETEYTLDLEGYEDPGELRRANDRLKQEAKDAKKALKEKEDADEANKNKNAKNRGDIDSLERSWKEKLDAAEATHKQADEKSKAQIRKLMVDNVADAMAREISTAPTLVSKLIRERLTVDLDGDEPVTRVLGGDGKLSALSLDDLKKEIRGNQEFAGIIRASNATGGGASGNQGGGAAKALKDMGDAERTEYFRRDPAGFQRESAALKAASQQLT